MDGMTDRWIDGCMEGLMGRMDGWMIGLTDRRTHGVMDGIFATIRINRVLNFYIPFSLNASIFFNYRVKKSAFFSEQPFTEPNLRIIILTCITCELVYLAFRCYFYKKYSCCD